jgi:hypothetical protein
MYLAKILGRLSRLRCIGSAQRGIPLELRTDSIDGDHIGMTVGRKVGSEPLCGDGRRGDKRLGGRTAREVYPIIHRLQSVACLPRW